MLLSLDAFPVRDRSSRWTERNTDRVDELKDFRTLPTVWKKGRVCVYRQNKMHHMASPKKSFC